MTLTEPTTFTTDLLLAAVGGAFGVRTLAAARAERDAPTALWGTGFICVGFGALAGAFHHGLAATWPAAAIDALWKITTALVGLTAALWLAAAIVAGFSGTLRSALLALTVFKLTAYLALALPRDDYLIVILDYAPTLVLVAALAAREHRRRNRPGAAWIVAGVAASLVAALAQRLRFSLSWGFNHNDAYHLLQIGALWLLYRGGRPPSFTPNAVQGNSA